MVGKVKVLLVDDNIQLLDSLKDFLSEKKDIDICGLLEDGQRAIEFLKDNHVDVLVLDIIMPKLDGMAVLDWLSENKTLAFPDIIVVTALRHEDVIRITSMKGVKYFMTKPFPMRSYIKESWRYRA